MNDDAIIKQTQKEIGEFLKQRPENPTVDLKQNSLNSRPKKVKVNWPNPLNPQAFYGLAGEVIRTIEPHSEADPVALLANFLTGIGSIFGDKPHFKVEADKHSGRCFINLVGDTSKARKGTSWGYLKQIFKELDSQWESNIKSGLSSGEGLIWAVVDKIVETQPIKKSGQVIDYQEVTINPGVSDKRLLIVESEFAATLRVLSREGNNLSAVIRNAWDSGDLQTLTKNSPAKATGAHISIIGHITTHELLHYLTDTEAANGFGNRFLWFCVRRSKILPFGSTFNDLDISSLIEKLRESISFATGISEVKWAEETKPHWASIYPKLSEGKSGLVGSMTARAEAYVVRLSVIYALLDKSDLILPQHLQAALAVWKYAEESVEYIFKDRTGDSIADDILEALIESPKGGLSLTEISSLFSRHKTSEQIASSLNLLSELGLAVNKTVTTEGRNKEIWFAVQREKSETSSLNSQIVNGISSNIPGGQIDNG